MSALTAHPINDCGKCLKVVSESFTIQTTWPEIPDANDPPNLLLFQANSNVKHTTYKICILFQKLRFLGTEFREGPAGPPPPDTEDGGRVRQWGDHELRVARWYVRGPGGPPRSLELMGLRWGVSLSFQDD